MGLLQPVPPARPAWPRARVGGAGCPQGSHPLGTARGHALSGPGGHGEMLAVALGWWLGVLGVLGAPGSSSGHWGVEHVGVPWVSPKGSPGTRTRGRGRVW